MWYSGVFLAIISSFIELISFLIVVAFVVGAIFQLCRNIGMRIATEAIEPLKPPELVFQMRRAVSFSGGMVMGQVLQASRFLD